MMRILVLAAGMVASGMAFGSSAGEARWWSFVPVARPAVPAVEQHGWPRHEVDRFLLARLETAGFAPAPDADPRIWIRRVTFGLTGLPPTPEEIASFLDDDAPGARERVVDRLLASPHYGERWGRHWLDVVRYADTAGDNGDFPMPEAYRYRNYVIESFNRDKPFDRFLIEQLAGDLLPAATPEARAEQIVATGYLAISRRFSSVAEEFHLTLDDTLDNLGQGLLGLTVSCARCHAHKFDPIPQEDYYALYGFFESAEYAFPGTEIYRHSMNLSPLMPEESLPENIRQLRKRLAEIDTEIYQVYGNVDELDAGPEKDRRKGRWQALQKERDALIKKAPAYAQAYAVREGPPRNARLQKKGDPKQLGDEIPRAFLSALGGGRLDSTVTNSGRLELAARIADPRNPLTARVMVNRIWQHHFGHGLVRTPNDFGTRGEPPTHPELLDYLADYFVQSGWSVKAMHRLILSSRAYGMAVVENADYTRRDPENRLLWTFQRRRLSAEEIRDSLLAVSGLLDRSPGRAHPFKPEWEWRYTQHHPFVDDFPSRHRSVYLMQSRFREQPYLGTFDGADANASTGQRKTSTTPQQALYMMNSEFVHEVADRLARRLAAEAGTTEARADRAYHLVFGRAPSAEETAECVAYLADTREGGGWPSYLRAQLSSNEFFFVD